MKTPEELAAIESTTLALGRGEAAARRLVYEAGREDWSIALQLELERCLGELEKAHAHAKYAHNDFEERRLAGKIEGVNLALGKLLELNGG